jgi:hypothetical protein
MGTDIGTTGSRAAFAVSTAPLSGSKLSLNAPNKNPIPPPTSNLKKNPSQHNLTYIDLRFFQLISNLILATVAFKVMQSVKPSPQPIPEDYFKQAYDLCLKNLNPKSTNINKTLEQLQWLATLGHTPSKQLLAKTYLEGSLVARDYHKAKFYLDQLDDQNKQQPSLPKTDAAWNTANTYQKMTDFNVFRFNLARILKSLTFIASMKYLSQLIAPLAWFFYVCQLTFEFFVINTTLIKRFQETKLKTSKEKISLYINLLKNLLHKDNRMLRMINAVVWGGSAILLLCIPGIVANLVLIAAYCHDVIQTIYMLKKANTIKTRKLAFLTGLQNDLDSSSEKYQNIAALKKETEQNYKIKVKELKIKAGVLSTVATAMSVALFTGATIHLVALAVVSTLGLYSIHLAFSKRIEKHLTTKAREIREAKPLAFSEQTKKPRFDLLDGLRKPTKPQPPITTEITSMPSTAPTA